MNDKMIDFLVRAKKAAYAGNGALMASSRPNSKELQFTEGDLKYINTSIGCRKFAGEEALWENDLPYWAMNYVGRVIHEGFSHDFLKKALLCVSRDRPYRGPQEYIDGPYRYQCNVKGEFDWFYGYEEIYYNDINVYECAFHGGMIENV